ncbi:hypothetical protein JVU11DRAFT_572 [Chiua virens]|nr:hypothetical protein JVU11DRAFT_572 [Chiua virens]
MSTHPQPSSSSSARRRKSTSKRLLVHSDDDSDAPAPPTSHRAKRARTASVSLTTTDDDNDMDVDIETFRDSTQRSLSDADDSRFLPEDAPDPSPPSTKRKKSTVVSAPTKKKSKAVSSDGESDSHFERDSVEDDLNDSALPLDDPSDDDFEVDAPKRDASKAKPGVTKGKSKPGQSRGAKEKEKDRDILMKDERKLTVPPTTTSRASSAAAQSQPSDLFSNEDLAPSSAVDAPPDALQSANDSLTRLDVSTPAAATQKPPPPPVQELPKASLPASEQRKQALTGVRDIDLGNSKIYAELFKSTGGNTPRSGLKNAEERRRELDKMRDEARAKRAEEAKFTFDLQAQADKIAHFEQRLRAENSTVVHPNFLAAKFRDEWEAERRNRRATPKEEGEA